MNNRLKVGFLFLFLISLVVLSSPTALADLKHLNIQSDQVLYFQPTKDPIMYTVWAMDTNSPSGPGLSEDAFYSSFVSPPLAQEFMFQTITVTIYHESVPSGRGTFSLNVNLIALTANGLPYTPVPPALKILNSGCTIDSVSINFATKLLKNERLSVQITISSSLGDKLKMHWGDSTHPSQVSYDGTASYIPEFPQTSLCLLLMATTLLAIVVYRKSHNSEQKKGTTVTKYYFSGSTI